MEGNANCNSGGGAGLPEDVGSLGAVGQDDRGGEVDQQGGACLKDENGRRAAPAIEVQRSSESDGFGRKVDARVESLASEVVQRTDVRVRDEALCGTVGQLSISECLGSSIVPDVLHAGDKARTKPADAGGGGAEVTGHDSEANVADASDTAHDAVALGGTEVDGLKSSCGYVCGVDEEIGFTLGNYMGGGGVA